MTKIWKKQLTVIPCPQIIIILAEWQTKIVLRFTKLYIHFHIFYLLLLKILLNLNSSKNPEIKFHKLLKDKKILHLKPVKIIRDFLNQKFIPIISHDLKDGISSFGVDQNIVN